MKLTSKAFFNGNIQMMFMSAGADIFIFTKIIVYFTRVIFLMRSNSNMMLINSMMMQNIERQKGNTKNCRQKNCDMLTKLIDTTNLG